jgi:ribosome-binding ATPase YchF (GTP1/OBG family)
VKISVIGIPALTLGKRNVKDPRLDLADRLVEAKKKTYAQVDLVGPEEALSADAIIAHPDVFPDLILKDLEFIENRLTREPCASEVSALEKLRAELESERTMHSAGLGAEDLAALAAHRFHTNRPVVVPVNGEIEDHDTLVLRAFRESGHISFLTVGGKENRAWAIRNGATAWEAAAAIHSDIQKGFIRAEVIGYDDFEQEGGETQAKRAGRLRLETKQYVIRDCDVVSFRFNK